MKFYGFFLICLFIAGGCGNDFQVSLAPDAGEGDSAAGSYTDGQTTDSLKPYSAPACDTDDYKQAAGAFQARHQFSPEWTDFILTHRERWGGAYCAATRRQKKFRVAVYYDKDPALIYKTLWPSEDEHMQALEKLLELTYPGWKFSVTFQGLQNQNDCVVYLGNDRSGANWEYMLIILHYETALSHEVAHLLGLNHHYGDYSGTTYIPGDGYELPPGDKNCLMDKTATEFCTGGRFALGLEMTDNSAELNKLVSEINERYK